MPMWVTHLMVADKVLLRFPQLDRRGFCVGNIAPDCNVENEDWTSFTPSREITHWMSGKRKSTADSDAFCNEYILKRRESIHSREQYAFLLGYYSHLITDGAFQEFTWDEQRVKAAWSRLKKDDLLRARAEGLEVTVETWDTLKKLIPKKERLREMYKIEEEYLNSHPNSGYLTEIMTLEKFPDYIDYLPKGAIARKIKVMGYMPEVGDIPLKFIAMSREEFNAFLESTVNLVISRFMKMGLL